MTATAKKSALVVGAGAFGTAISSVLAYNFEKVILETRCQSVYGSLRRGENGKYLPGSSLPYQIIPRLQGEKGWDYLLENVELLVMAVPVAALGEYIEQNKEELRKLLRRGVSIVCLSKGIDSKTLRLPDEIFIYGLGGWQGQFCFLSGPSFAREILERQVTMVTLAGSDSAVLDKVARFFTTDFFKVTKSDDVKGVLLGGALKNIIAIAGGIVEGMGFNHNTRAALVTVAIKEMLRVGAFYKAQAETFYGLSGMGDLVLTITGGMSRNKKFGLELAKGREPEEILSSFGFTVEGYKTAKSIYLLCEEHGIDCPIFRAIYRVIYEGFSPEDVLKQLLREEPFLKVET